jgi:hypothetical protein
MAGNNDNFVDDMKLAAHDLLNGDVLQAGQDVLDAAKAAAAGRLFSAAYQPGVSAQTFNPTQNLAQTAADLATAGVVANFIEGTVTTSPEQSASIEAANKAISQAESQVSAGAAGGGTEGELLAAYGNLRGSNPEVGFAAARVSAALDRVRQENAKTREAAARGDSVSSVRGQFNTVDDYLAFKANEKAKRESIQPTDKP